MGASGSSRDICCGILDGDEEWGVDLLGEPWGMTAGSLHNGLSGVSDVSQLDGKGQVLVSEIGPEFFPPPKGHLGQIKAEAEASA